VQLSTNGHPNDCITLPMNKAPHGKEHLFKYELTIQLKLSILFVGKVKITPFNGSRPFLCGSMSDDFPPGVAEYFLQYL
jgi:hypothetical protein